MHLVTYDELTSICKPELTENQTKQNIIKNMLHAIRWELDDKELISILSFI